MGDRPSRDKRVTPRLIRRPVSVARGASPRYIATMVQTIIAGSAAAARPILRLPAASLRQTARPVTDADRDEVAALVPVMLRTMYEAPGIGLAAPQIGVPLRAVVIDLADEDDLAARTPLVLVNPEILTTSDERVVREEGCLSIPGVYADVERPARVTVRYQDAGLVSRVLEADGLLAACVQHEIDHLDGVLFVDHLSALKRSMLLRRFAKEQRNGSGEKGRTGRARAPA